MFLRPRYSELESRSLADTSVDFLGKKYKLPVIPSNMEDVISIDNAKQLASNGYYYIMHRFGDIKSRYEELDASEMNISIGVTDDDKRFIEGFIYTPFSITIDVAHAHHSNVKSMVDHLKHVYRGESYNNRPRIIAGNVATADGFKFLYDLGVDAIKVGIGTGSICTTKYKTGFHLPIAYSIYECANLRLHIPLIADGGLRHYGDVAKALTLGATMVMGGGWFASCIDSPAKIIHGKKIYRGSTSFEAKGHNSHVEGRALELDEGITYMERMEEIRQSLASSISYAGGKDLTAFNHVEWSLQK
jgi:GMP reductase